MQLYIKRTVIIALSNKTLKKVLHHNLHDPDMVIDVIVGV